MNHEQDRRSSRTNGHGSQSVPTLLPCDINAIRLDQAALIFKDECRQFERDAAVLALVLPVFPLIPFVAHCVYTNYSTDRLGKQTAPTAFAPAP